MRPFWVWTILTSNFVRKVCVGDTIHTGVWTPYIMARFTPTRIYSSSSNSRSTTFGVFQTRKNQKTPLHTKIFEENSILYPLGKNPGFGQARHQPQTFPQMFSWFREDVLSGQGFRSLRSVDSGLRKKNPNPVVPSTGSPSLPHEKETSKTISEAAELFYSSVVPSKNGKSYTLHKRKKSRSQLLQNFSTGCWGMRRLNGWYQQKRINLFLHHQLGIHPKTKKVLLFSGRAKDHKLQLVAKNYLLFSLSPCGKQYFLQVASNPHTTS